MTNITSPDPWLDEKVGPGIEVQHHRFERSWGSQHVVTAGPLGAPAIMLVHGWPEHWFAWRHVIAALAATHRVVAVDLRGFGWSTLRPDWLMHTSTAPVLTAAAASTTTMGELASDLVATLDDLGIDHAALAAHDWGGWIGFRAVLDHPARFHRYCALAIVPPWLEPSKMLRHVGGWSYVFPMAAVGHRVATNPRAVRWLMDNSTHGELWAAGEGMVTRQSYVERIGDAGAAAMTRHLYARLVTHELPKALGKDRPPRLGVPATVLVGQHETIARPDLYWARTWPGELRVVTVPEARHWLAEEQPGAVVAHLVSVLDADLAAAG